METKNSWKSLGARTLVRAAPDRGFKRCCLPTGRCDGTNRSYFFQRVGPRARVGEICNDSLVDFRFLFAIVEGGEGNRKTAGGSIASLGSPEPLAVTLRSSCQEALWKRGLKVLSRSGAGRRWLSSLRACRGRLCRLCLERRLGEEFGIARGISVIAGIDCDRP